jgi:hypothetical protein
MNAMDMPTDWLALLLHDTAAGISPDAAAVHLICAHRHFLDQPAFRRIIVAGSAACAGEPVAVIRWRAAEHALEHGLLPCSSSEAAILRVACSLGDPAISVHLRDVLGGLDARNINLVTAAITAANGH